MRADRPGCKSRMGLRGSNRICVGATCQAEQGLDIGLDVKNVDWHGLAAPLLGKATAERDAANARLFAVIITGGPR